MHLLSSLLILLTASRLLGRLFQSIGYFAIIGEILAGFLLGPAIFNFIDPDIRGLRGIVELGVFLLIFSAGLEIDIKEFLSSFKNKALLNGLITFVSSFAVGMGFGAIFNLGLLSSLVIGLCFAITAIPVAIKFLQNIKWMDSPGGTVVIGTAIVIEILSLLVLGISSSFSENEGWIQFFTTVLIKGGSMLGFFLLVLLVNKFFRSEFGHIKKTQKFVKRLLEALDKEAVFGIGVFFVLIFSTISEALGFHFIIGAFFGGLLLNKDVIGTNFFDSLSLTLNSITSHFLTPIFFAYLGLLIQLEAFYLDNATFVFSLLVAGYLVKIISAFIGSNICGFNKKESLKMGLILNSRGTFDLIVAEIAFVKGYIDSKVFSILVVFGVFSVILNPVIYRRFFNKSEDTKT